MKKNSLKVLSVISASIIPFAITPLIVSCSKNEEDLSNVKMYDKNYRILFNGAGEILDYDGIVTELEIPEYLENNSITSSSYYGKRIKINKIGYRAFKWDEEEDNGRPKLQKITLPNSVTWIDRYAFDNNSLTQVTIPNSVTRIDDGAFIRNPLTQVTIPNSVKYLSGFNETKITNINIPNSVTGIGFYAFANTQLTQVTIPNSVITIDKNAFAYTPLTQVTIPNSVTEIGYFAFASTELTQVTIPNSVTEIGSCAFYRTNIKEVILPEKCYYYKNSFPSDCKITGGIIK